MESVTGIEPVSPPYEGGALPTRRHRRSWYWRRDSNPHEAGFKPAASSGLEPDAYAVRPRQHGVQGWIRTTALFGTRSTGGRIRPLCHLHIGAPGRI